MFFPGIPQTVMCGQQKLKNPNAPEVIPMAEGFNPLTGMDYPDPDVIRVGDT